MRKNKTQIVNKGTVRGITIGNIYRLPKGRFAFSVIQIDIYYNTLRDSLNGILKIDVTLQAYDLNILRGDLRFLAPFKTSIDNELF